MIALAAATVYLFLSTDCPLSNRYTPELKQLEAQYQNKNITFLPVFSDTQLARKLGASVTPQAVVTSPTGAVLYRGNTGQGLTQALEAITTGYPVPNPETRAIGCAITFPTSPKSTAVTWSKQVAPIIFKYCAPCHRPGQSGPFPLLSYQQAAPKAAAITQFTAARTMPPWLPQPGPPHFLNERRLTPSEIETLRQWSEAGAPQGDPKQAPPLPVFHDGWKLGQPDLLSAMPKPFQISPDGPDEYRCFVLPIKNESDRWVRAMEFAPDNRRVLHHALVFADTSGGARRHDYENPGDGYPCFGVPGFLPAASYGGWTPGMQAETYPDGVSFLLPRNADLVLQLHYTKTGKQEQDQSRVALYFADKPPTRRLMDVALVSRNIDIPPGDADYKVSDYFTLPVDVTLIGIIPHAHYIARRMHGVAILPDQSRITLLDIREWDFNWQQQYRYAKPIRLPAGTEVQMEFSFDNSAANPRNPSTPPRRVTWGPSSTDEMAGLHLQVIPDTIEDAKELGQYLWGKIMREFGGR